MTRDRIEGEGTLGLVKADPKQWPRTGFEAFFDSTTNFIHLNINLGSAAACQKYHDASMQRYRRAMANWSDYDIAVWAVRLRQSLKLAFSATYFALSSHELRAQRSMAASAYLAYYSALHAMWSVVYLESDQQHERLTGIGHSSLSETFANKFTGDGNILRVNTRELVEDLRFLREYYSYRMPLNSPIDTDGEVAKAYIHLGGFVKQSIQLANLHSHLIRKAAERSKKQCAMVPLQEHRRFRELYFLINGKEHAGRRIRALDPADRRAEREFLTRGCDLMPLSWEYEHMFDDFMTYVDGSQPNHAMIVETRKLVGGAFW